VAAAASARFLPLCKIVGLSFLPAESSKGLPEIGYCEDYVRSLKNSNERGLVIGVCGRYFDDLNGQPIVLLCCWDFGLRLGSSSRMDL
jgi:hypothetical protein